MFVDYLCRCAVLACDEATSSAGILADLPARWREAAPSRADSAPEKIIDGLLDTPLLTIDSAAHRHGISRTAATTAISRLEDAGVLRFIGRGRRDQAWAAGDVLDESESLVERIEQGRRRLLTPRITEHLRSRGMLGD